MMHDWTLVSIKIEWLGGIVTVTLKNNNSKVEILIAKEFLDLKIPKREDWGESVSVNAVYGPLLLDNGNTYLSIEIQSGDKIEIEAKTISMPTV